MSGPDLVDKMKDTSPWQVIINSLEVLFLPSGGLFVRVSAVFNMTHLESPWRGEKLVTRKFLKKLLFIFPW
jgi:GDP-D-mannose dehydratase